VCSDSMTIDGFFWIAGSALEASFIALLWRRRAVVRFPFLSLFILWDFIQNLALYLSSQSNFHYTVLYLFFSTIGYFFEFCVLIELMRSILKPLPPSARRRLSLFTIFSYLILAALLWTFLAKRPIDPNSSFHAISFSLWVSLQMQRISSYLRLITFLTLALFSQTLSLTWHNRELQIATGLGCYSFFTVAVEIARSHLPQNQLYIDLNRVLIASYLGSLCYWIYCFASKEEQRSGFTPEMEEILQRLAGRTRTRNTQIPPESDLS